MREVRVMGQESSDFTTFTKKQPQPQLQQPQPQPQPQQSQQTQTPQLQPQPQQPQQRYEAHLMANCYPGHGAVEIGSVAVTHSIAACGLLCDQDLACMGFV